MPETAFDKAAEDLENSIDEAVSVLGKESVYPLTDKIFNTLQLSEDPTAKNLPEEERLKLKNKQTRRIAGAMIANALIFQERIAPAYPKQNIPLVHDIRQYADRKQRALTAWQKILDINYWPIFATARDILRLLPAHKASPILEKLAAAAERIHEDGLLYENDLTGHVFQKLIIDRKYLAAFYTLPESAALLARIAVSKMKDLDWSNADEIRKLKIADFACGTGALLSAVYDQIANRYERHDKDPKKLHRGLMEKVLYGFDVLPFATHLTASVLSGKYPDVIYDRSRIYTMPFGRQKDKEVKIGSLEFLGSVKQPVLVHTGDPDKQTGGQGEDLLRVDVWNNLDLIIMNPPFTRPTNHEGKHARIINPAFAAFGASDQDMRDMGERLKTIVKKTKTCYDGKAGLASVFAGLANKKLKQGGVLALVLPLVSASGSSWQKFRTLLAKNYEDIEVISLATPKRYDVAFSAHTAMADCLVIARKKSPTISARADKPTRFISLHRRPDKLAAAGETARELNDKETERKLEDGPFGGDDIDCGEEKMGEAITANIPRTNPHWNAARVRDFELIQTAYQLTQKKLWLPKCESIDLPITQLKNVGTRGVVDRLIAGPPHPAPFYHTKSTPKPNDNDGYPALWNHDCEKERQILCQPDKKLKAERGQEARANELWRKIAGKCFFNLNFTLGSQSLAIAFTKRKCIGGGAWPNVNFPKKSWDYAFALWGNSTLGLILHWWHGNRQQPGRSRVSWGFIETLPVLDFRKLSDAQIKQAKTIFDRFKHKSFQPAFRADTNTARAELDRAVLCEWLGFDEKVWKAVRGLARKWCAEPSVHGGKQRHKNNTLIS